MTKFKVGKYYKPIVPINRRHNIAESMRAMWDGKPHKCIGIYSDRTENSKQLANFEGVEPIEEGQHGFWWWYPMDFIEVNGDIQLEFDFDKV